MGFLHSYCERGIYRRIYQLFALHFWQMTRQGNDNLIYPFQFGSVKKEKVSFSVSKSGPLPPFSHVFAEQGYVDNLTVLQ